MRETAREGAEHLYTDRTQASIAKVAEEALSDIIWMGFESLKDDLKKSSYVFLEHASTDTAHKCVLNDSLDQSIERWTQTSEFMDVYTRRA